MPYFWGDLKRDPTSENCPPSVERPWDLAVFCELLAFRTKLNPKSLTLALDVEAKVRG